MLALQLSSQFKKDLKKIAHQNKIRIALDEIVLLLQQELPLPVKNRDHALTGSWKGYRECHIMPDWLLIYKVEKTLELLQLVRTGSHSELF